MINDDRLNQVISLLRARPRRAHRQLIALCGAPGSGKSTLAEPLLAALGQSGIKACVVPMDGFHLDNTLLRQRGLLPRKGAPETFDSGGLAALIARLAQPGEVVYPVFDRSRDIAIAGVGLVEHDTQTVIVEGNYLLYDAPDSCADAENWRAVRAHWDLRIFLQAPPDLLRQRLIKRWLDHGLDQAAAIQRAEQNDLKNMETVLNHLSEYDIAL